MIEPIELLVDPDLLANGATAARPGNLFPSKVARSAMAISETFLPTLSATMLTGYRPRGIQFVQVPKWDTTTRPAADMPLADEVIFATLTDYLKQRLHPDLVVFTGVNGDGASYAQFEQYPLTIEGAHYVLEVDAVSFYEYVDHYRLGGQLVGLTGEATTTNALLGLLEGWLGVPRGLPQGPAASAILADIYIAPVARTLSRAGFNYSRYSDDFKVVARTWDEVRSAQLLLEGAMRDVGLVIAAGKLRTPSLEGYADMLEVVAEGEAEYEPGDEQNDQPDEQQLESAYGTMRACVEEQGVTIERSRLLRGALAVLRRARFDQALPLVPRLLNRYPHATQNLAAYIQSLMQHPAEANALEILNIWLSSSGFRFQWQTGWMLHAACFAAERNTTLGQWVEPLIFSDSYPWFVRGQAAIALAVHGDLPRQASYFNVYEAAPEVTKPDLIAAVLIGNPRWKSQFLAGVQTGPLLEATARLDPAEYRGWL